MSRSINLPPLGYSVDKIFWTTANYPFKKESLKLFWIYYSKLYDSPDLVALVGKKLGPEMARQDFRYS